MTVQLDWPPEVVARLNEEAREHGLSLDAYVLQTVLQRRPQDGNDIERGGRLASQEADLQSGDRDKRVEELFEAFDSTSVPAGVSEEAFHRDTWYR